jgi:hypothetical protein
MSLRFDTAGRVEEVVWCMRLAELLRAENRTVLNRMFNGQPPFDEATAEENGVQVNRNFLEGVNLLAQGRRQWNNAYLKPGNYFNVSVDSGPSHKRREWSKIITKNLNRALKRSPDYMETLRATGANVVLHGIAPSNWESRTAPFHCPLGVEDLLVPSDTLVSFRNLDHFAIFRQYSPATLYELTHGPKRDPGWNMGMVRDALQWAGTEYSKNAYSLAYQFMPEKIEEYIKQDIGFWGSDAPPTIDCWDFYFREAEDGNGWYRRVVMDSPLSSAAVAAWRSGGTRPQLAKKDQWLYTSGKRKFADSLRSIIHCQFGDTSAVAPFRYHSVRSLGYMLWGVCELQNRLRCKFSEAVFEQMMWFFRSSNEGQMNRIKKAMFTNMGVIPEGISFVTANERFKPDHQLVNLMLSQNRQLMGENAASFTQDFRQGGEQEMTATETMARVNAVNALVSGMLNLSYVYETYQYRETCRRFCLKNSQHAEVKKFRLACLKDGVPEEMLDVDRWDVEPERVLGAGNKTLEIAQAQQLLQMRPTLGPEAQQTVDHIAVEAFTDDPALAENLVPLDARQKVSTAKHDAMLAVGTIMQGGVVQFGEEHNRRDLVETLLLEMALIVQRIVSMGGMATAQEVTGLQNLGNHIAQIIAMVEQDKGEQERAKQYQDQLGNLMNAVKGFAQRLAEQQQAAGTGANGEAMAETAGKVQALQIQATAKAANSRESHAQKTAQRQVQFETQQKQREDEHQLEMRRQMESQQVEDLTQGAKTVAEIQRENAKAANIKTTSE